MIIINWLVLGWVICGVFAYGIAKASMRNFYMQSSCAGYNEISDFLCWTLAFTGPMGLVATLIICSCREDEIGLCYRMPKELCEPREVK